MDLGLGRVAARRRADAQGSLPIGDGRVQLGRGRGLSPAQASTPPPFTGRVGRVLLLLRDAVRRLRGRQRAEPPQLRITQLPQLQGILQAGQNRAYG